MPSIIMPSVIMPSIIMPSVVMPIATVPSVVAPLILVMVFSPFLSDFYQSEILEKKNVNKPLMYIINIIMTINLATAARECFECIE